MESAPRSVRQAGPSRLAVAWADGTEQEFEVYELRCACPCASCVDETTGKRTLVPARVPRDVRPVRVQSVGNYGLRIAWSDGHDTGIYTWERLRGLGHGP
ncbi:MAG: DUF971 domain-containing protein [Planctomycetota bacterium]